MQAQSPTGRVVHVGTGDERHGRRDNGLTATEYAAAGDVDPRVGEHLLDVLALEGIAAYLRPSSDLHPVTRTNLLPGRPTDRLYVDRGHLGTARAYLARLAESPAEGTVEGTSGGTAAGTSGGTVAGSADATSPSGATARTEPAGAERPPVDPTAERPPLDPTADPPAPSGRGEPDFNDAWAKIVAGLQADGPRPPWPEPEDPTRSGRIGPGRSRLTLGGRMAPSTSPTDEPSLLDGLDTFGADLPDADEEEFTPPPAPPVPRPSAATVLAVVGIIGGLAVFLRPQLLPTSAGLAMFLGVVALLAGFGALIWRLRPGDDDEPDPDDGARV